MLFAVINSLVARIADVILGSPCLEQFWMKHSIHVRTLQSSKSIHSMSKSKFTWHSFFLPMVPVCLIIPELMAIAVYFDVTSSDFAPINDLYITSSLGYCQRKAETAGLSTPPSWLHLVGAINSSTSEIRLSKKVLNLLSFLSSQLNTTVLHVFVYGYKSFTGMKRMSAAHFNILAKINAPHSSRPRMISCLTGATFVFTITIATFTSLIKSVFLKKTISAYTFSDASQIPCNCLEVKVVISWQ